MKKLLELAAVAGAGFAGYYGAKAYENYKTRRKVERFLTENHDALATMLDNLEAEAKSKVDKLSEELATITDEETDGTPSDDGKESSEV